MYCFINDEDATATTTTITTTTTTMDEHVVYERRDEQSEWDAAAIADVVKKFLRDPRTAISAEVASVDGEPEVVNDRLLLWLKGIEEPLRYESEVKRWLGRECSYTFETHKFSDSTVDNGVVMAARPCIEFDFGQAQRTILRRRAVNVGQIVLMMCCICAFAVFFFKLAKHWEGYDAPWTDLWCYLA